MCERFKKEIFSFVNRLFLGEESNASANQEGKRQLSDIKEETQLRRENNLLK